VPIRVSAVDDVLMQRVNGGDGITAEGTLVQHILLCLMSI
jgi:hypothetical protein